MNAEDNNSRWPVFLFAWVMVTTLSWSLGARLMELDVEFENELLTQVLSTSLIFSPILLTGLGQWGVLYWRYKAPTGWLGAALVSCLLLILISPILFALTAWLFPPGSFTLTPDYYGPTLSALEVLAGTLVIFSMLGTAIAIPPWVVLRRSMKSAGAWILISILAWLVSYPLFQISAFSSAVTNLNQIIREVIWGFILGIIPGAFLTFKLRKTRVAPASARLLNLDRGAGIVTFLVVVFIPVLVFFNRGAKACGWLDQVLGRSGCVSETAGYSFNLGNLLTSKGELFTAEDWATDFTVQFHQIPDGKFLRSIDVGEADYLVVDPTGDILAIGNKGEIQLWSILEEHQFRTFGDASTANEVDEITKMQFSPSGNLLLVEYHAYPSRPLELWQVADGTLLTTLDIPHPNTYLFSADEEVLIVGARDGKVWRWTASGLELLLFEDSGWVQDLEFTPDGQMLVAAWEGGVLQAWNTADWRVREIAALENTTRSTVEIAFSSDGQLMVARHSAGNVQVWNVSNWSLARTLEPQSADCVAIMPEGGLLAVGSSTSLFPIELWDVETGILLTEIEGACAITFSSDGSFLISEGSEIGTVRIWDIADWVK